mgnify:CR=1 FL=1
MKFIDSEKAHDLSVNVLAKFGQNRGSQKILSSIYRTPSTPINVFGKLFRHPLGLAAGFDKSATALSAWPALGFSWVEYGGITRYPQDGNPKPRMFRSDNDLALINRMGFNNPGALAVRDQCISRRVSGKWPQVPVAANIGRSKSVDNNRAPNDYAETFSLLYDHADLFVLNVSSPNTPGLRAWQGKNNLSRLVSTLQDKRASLISSKGGNIPLLIKLAPDIDEQSRADIASVAVKCKVDGLLISNTTVKRPASLTSIKKQEPGGLSGRPLFKTSTSILADMYRRVNGEIPLVGIGGVSSGEDAYIKIRAGAALVQLYTALIYKGPQLVDNIKISLAEHLAKDGFKNITAAIGIDSTKY